MAFNWGTAPPTPRKLGWVLIDKRSLNHLKIRQACRHEHTVLLQVFCKRTLNPSRCLKGCLRSTQRGLPRNQDELICLNLASPPRWSLACEPWRLQGKISLQAFAALSNLFLDPRPVQERISCSNWVLAASNLHTALWMVVTAASSQLEQLLLQVQGASSHLQLFNSKTNAVMKHAT